MFIAVHSLTHVKSLLRAVVCAEGWLLLYRKHYAIMSQSEATSCLVSFDSTTILPSLPFSHVLSFNLQFIILISNSPHAWCCSYYYAGHIYTVELTQLNAMSLEHLHHHRTSQYVCRPRPMITSLFPRCGAIWSSCSAVSVSIRMRSSGVKQRGQHRLSVCSRSTQLSCFGSCRCGTFIGWTSRDGNH